MKNNLLIFLFLIGLGLHAQTKLPPTCEAFLPKVLLKSLISESDALSLNAGNNFGQSDTPTRRYWMVYSDRDDNITYTEPNKNSAEFKRLSLNEELRIAKVKGNFALVYSERKNGAWPEISELAECKGWVPMEKLLLWQSCPTNEKGIYYKALIVANLDKKMSEDIGRVYRNPENKLKFTPVKSSIDFFFVMKRDLPNKLVLLAREYTLGGTNSQQLVGWVGTNTYVPWNQRSCLEPNWNPDDVSYFKANNQIAKVYPDRSDKKTFFPFNFGNPNDHDKNRMTKFRMPNESLRYPILDNDTDDKSVYKCMSFGAEDGNLGNAMIEQQKQETIRKQYLSMIENVNLTIVIDGTTSMDKYFTAMKEGVKDALTYLHKDYKVRVGVVIYRDYPDGDYCTEYLPLQDKQDIGRVNNFLDNGGDGVYGIKSGKKDHTHEEALYKGIEVALDSTKMGFTSKQSNLLLVVGDCGNAEKDSLCLSQQQLVDKLVESNVQLMVFQVNRNDLKPWQLFKQQMLVMLQSNMSKQYKALGNAKAHFYEVEDGRDLKTNSKKVVFVSSFRYPPVDGSMTQEKLKEQLIRGISDFNEAIKEQISIIDGAGSFAVNTDDNGSQFAIDKSFIISRWGPEGWEKLKNTGTRLAFKGYTKKMHPSGRAYWKPVIFISGDELDQLIKRLMPVYEISRNGGDDREKYLKAMKALIRSLIPDISEVELANKGVDEVMNLIAGLNEGSDALRGRGPSLMDISDPNVVSHQQFQSICAEFAKKFRNVQRIKQQRYEYVVRTNNKTYYWIPIEDMP